MFSTTTAKTFFSSMAYDISFLLLYELGLTLSILAALLSLGFALRRVSLWIYDGGLGESARNFGKPPWKGYNRWRSRRWNIEHTAL